MGDQRMGDIKNVRHKGWRYRGRETQKVEVIEGGRQRVRNTKGERYRRHRRWEI